MRFNGAFILAGLALVGHSVAAVNPNPPSRVHVRTVGDKYYKFTSKLKTVVELNFTLNFNHIDGKKAWTEMLDKVATDYGVGGAKAFTVKKFTGGNGGSSRGLPTTIPTLADFNSAEVIVTNNISDFNTLKTANATMATAFETAVKTNGKSVFGIHGSGDGGTGWAFYTDDLHPVKYNAHGSQTAQPVYKNNAEAKHVINDSLLLTGNVSQKEVPMGLNGTTEVKATTTIRMMKNEWYRFGRDLLNDPTYGPMTTCLMRYDPTNIGAGDLPNEFKYKGGNPYVWMIKVGAGKALYIPAGHDYSELTTGSSFDGGSGDFERFFAQSLFFLAGYDSAACGTSDCLGLPIADNKAHLTGKVCGTECASTVSVTFRPEIGFSSMSGKSYVARLTDVRGRLVATQAGKGSEPVRFDQSRLNPGVYFLSVKVGKEAPVVQRYMISPSPI